MTDLSREAVTAAVQIADLTHLLKHHALQALRDANRQLHEAADTIGRLLEARSASMQERIAVIDALGLVATTLTLGASTIDLQACSCTSNAFGTANGAAGADEVDPAQSAASPDDGSAPRSSRANTPTTAAERSLLSPEQEAAIERGYVERPRGKVIDLGVRLKRHEWSTGKPSGPGGAA